jgi:hypothetical protein
VERGQRLDRVTPGTSLVICADLLLAAHFHAREHRARDRVVDREIRAFAVYG